MKIEQNPDRIEAIGYADLPIITLKEYQFTQQDIGRDMQKHGRVWTNRCGRCNHISYASQWKVETAIDQIIGIGSLGA
jgi:hypothetical protein